RSKARRSRAEQRFPTKLRDWIVRSRIRYSVLAAMRMLLAASYVLSHPNAWDVVSSSSHFGFDTVPMLLARRTRARAVYFWHHFTKSAQRPPWVRAVVRSYEEILARVIARTGVRVIAGNSLTKAWLEQRGV